MAQSMINFRIDEELKKKMEDTCKELGMNMTTAFTIFAKKVANEKRIPFDVCVDTFYYEKNMENLKKSILQMKQGQVVEKNLKELEDMVNE